MPNRWDVACTANAASKFQSQSAASLSSSKNFLTIRSSRIRFGSQAREIEDIRCQVLMDAAAIRQYLAGQDRAISDVLGQYVDEHGCPCCWPQFEYWVSKPHGPGWQDNVQNELINAALKLQCFRQRKPETPKYGLEAIVTCSECDREWQYFSEEWRMLAFHYRLIPVQPSAAAERGAALVGANVFATAGQEPCAARTLSLADWVKFMLGPPAGGTQSSRSLSRGAGPGPRSPRKSSVKKRGVRTPDNALKPDFPQTVEDMIQKSQRSDRISPAARVFFLALALFCVYLGVSVKIDHPMQLVMDFLAPIPPLLMAATSSYGSTTTKLAFLSSLLLWGSMIAAPLVFPSPLVF